MLKYFILFFTLRVCLFASVGDDDGQLVEMNADDSSVGNGEAVINGTFYHTSKSYYCRSTSTNNQELLVYGSSAWTFPLQDVNLTLKYPPNNTNTESDEVYMITELRVMLFMDGSDSRGYITNGGLLQNKMSMTFIVGNVTRLSYQFWLYGTTQLPPTTTENYNTIQQHIC